jgi:hypothetical protein
MPQTFSEAWRHDGAMAGRLLPYLSLSLLILVFYAYKYWKAPGNPICCTSQRSFGAANSFFHPGSRSAALRSS